jgi:sugar phosphate isomerase/epimerase
MRSTSSVSRRSFLALAGATPLATKAANKGRPVGLELFSVREELAKDLDDTVRAVATMGYQLVEFYAPYYQWTTDQAKDVRKLMDNVGIRCNSTHNHPESFSAEGMQKAIDLNKILGAKYIVLASAGKVDGLDGWKKVAEQLSHGSEKFKKVGLRAGYHNHKAEFVPVDGKRPMEVIAANTPKDVMLQMDVGTIVEAGSDPVAWIKANPGRINSMHVKDWGKAEGYKVLFGEGESPWAKIFDAAEKVGGVEYYLIEQEGSRFPPFESAERCLVSYKKFRGL